jgi:hypothetical protein
MSKYPSCFMDGRFGCGGGVIGEVLGVGGKGGLGFGG